jgi:nitroreductase
MFKQMIKKSIHKSQHCNRNWDLSKSIPQEDVDLIIESATQCPVKQNLNYYKTHVITDRDEIEKIHDKTVGIMSDNGVMLTNSQNLANLMLVFTKDTPKMRREQVEEELGDEAPTYTEDRLMSIGIASAYVNLTASLLGYETGCCKCFDGEAISEDVNGEEPLLIMGIGYPDKDRNRLEHHSQPEHRMPSMPNMRTVAVHA